MSWNHCAEWHYVLTLVEKKQPSWNVSLCRIAEFVTLKNSVRWMQNRRMGISGKASHGWFGHAVWNCRVQKEKIHLCFISFILVPLYGRLTFWSIYSLVLKTVRLAACTRGFKVSWYWHFILNQWLEKKCRSFEKDHPSFFLLSFAKCIDFCHCKYINVLMWSVAPKFETLPLFTIICVIIHFPCLSFS